MKKKEKVVKKSGTGKSIEVRDSYLFMLVMFKRERRCKIILISMEFLFPVRAENVFVKGENGNNDLTVKHKFKIVVRFLSDNLIFL